MKRILTALATLAFTALAPAVQAQPDPLGDFSRERAKPGLGVTHPLSPNT